VERPQAHKDKQQLRRAALAKTSGSETEIRVKNAAGFSYRQLAAQYGGPIELD
jgi:hypothetical protein